MNYQHDIDAAAHRLRALQNRLTAAVVSKNVYEARRCLRAIKEEARTTEVLVTATIHDLECRLKDQFNNLEKPYAN